MTNLKRVTISKKFSLISLVIAILTIIVAYFVLNYYKSIMIEDPTHLIDLALIIIIIATLLNLIVTVVNLQRFY